MRNQQQRRINHNEGAYRLLSPRIGLIIALVTIVLFLGTTVGDQSMDRSMINKSDNNGDENSTRRMATEEKIDNGSETGRDFDGGNPDDVEENEDEDDSNLQIITKEFADANPIVMDSLKLHILTKLGLQQRPPPRRDAEETDRSTTKSPGLWSVLSNNESSSTSNIDEDMVPRGDRSKRSIDSPPQHRRRRHHNAKKSNRRNHNRPSPCKRHQLIVYFDVLGWDDWIIAPPALNVYFCAGECRLPLSAHMNATNHAIVQSMINSLRPGAVPKPSCVATELGPAHMLTYDASGLTKLIVYPDMIVQACGCR